MYRDNAIEIFSTYQSKIPEEGLSRFKKALERAPEDAYDEIFDTKIYSIPTTVILSVLFGFLGVDRFYIGDVGIGICKLLFGWLTLGIWPFVDIFCSYRKAKRKNLENLLCAL